MKRSPLKIGRSFPLTAEERTVAIQISMAHLSSTVSAPVNLSVDALHAMWSIYKNALRDAFDQDRVAPRGARTTRAKRSPRSNQNDCASTSEQGGADAPAHGRDYALDERLTRPATLTDVQPARPRDRVGANPQLKVHGASAHSARRFLHKSRQSPRQPAVW